MLFMLFGVSISSLYNLLGLDMFIIRFSESGNGLDTVNTIFMLFIAYRLPQDDKMQLKFKIHTWIQKKFNLK